MFALTFTALAAHLAFCPAAYEAACIAKHQPNEATQNKALQEFCRVIGLQTLISIGYSGGYSSNELAAVLVNCLGGLHTPNNNFVATYEAIAAFAKEL